ncbi:MAG: hypothetical protein ABR571_08430 [Jatrophihabitans sp.]|uniref:hypothetical protein n=1 Tax=Jatrophihabitans sp. TaxID=1932789 RepID=UPI0039120CDE
MAADATVCEAMAAAWQRLKADAVPHRRGMAERTDAEKIEIVRQILAEPVPKWFQNAHRRANSYADQLRQIAEVVNGPAAADDGEASGPQ